MLFKLLKFIARLNFINSGIRYRLAYKLANPQTLSSHPFEEDFFGLKYKGNLNSHIDWNVYFWGSYEGGILKFLKHLTEKINDPVFIDIGANVGQHSLFMSKYSKNVISFEPYILVRTQFEENVKLNGISNITILPFGLSNKTEELEYFAPSSSNLGTGSFIETVNQSNKKLRSKLQVVCGDEFFAEKGVEKIDIVKIDVEGYEKYVLEGLRQTLNETRPLILMEFTYARKMFSDEESLMELFPENYKALKLQTIGLNAYALQPFDFQMPTNDLILFPVEKFSLGEN